MFTALPSPVRFYHLYMTRLLKTNYAMNSFDMHFEQKNLINNINHTALHMWLHIHLTMSYRWTGGQYFTSHKLDHPDIAPNVENYYFKYSLMLFRAARRFSFHFLLKKLKETKMLKVITGLVSKLEKKFNYQMLISIQ